MRGSRMDCHMRDLRFSLRALRRYPAFSAIAILAFGLGIGANTAIFSVVDSVLLRSMNYAEPDRLVVLEHAGPGPVAPATFLDWKAQARSFDQMAAAQAWGGSLRTSERPESVAGLRVSANMFSLLGSSALLGRTFAADEDRDNAAPVVVLAYSLWQRSFGGAHDIVGRQIDIDGVSHTVVGVMPAAFQFAPFWVTKAEMWAPLTFGQRKSDRTGASLRVFGRLRNGAQLNQAQAEMSTIMTRLAQQYPAASAKETVSVTPLRERVVGNIRPMLLVLAGTVGFVLLIACANVANLMLARAAGRKREMSVRVALGASRWQLIRQTVTESAVLSGIGGMLAVAIAYGALFVLSSVLPPETLPRQREIAMHPGVLVFTAALSVLTGILAGLIPAWHSSRSDVNESLKEGGRSGSEGKSTHQVRSALIASEVALAFVLLIGAGLMLRTFGRLISQDPGFDASNLLTLQVSVSGTKVAEPSLRPMFYREVLERISATPGVTAASAVNHAPMTGDVWGTRFRVEGRPEPLPGEWPGAVYRVAMPKYFATLKTPILQGRDFDDRDTLRAPRVVIVNETLARKWWPSGDALGKRIATRNDAVWFTIAGVVRDIKQSDWQANPREEIYFPFSQSADYLSTRARHFEFMTFVVRTTDVAAVRHAVESVDSTVLVSEVITMDRAVFNKMWRHRLALLLLGAFGVVALTLAITGIYGVISHAVSQRTREIGIRMALGAAGKDVLARCMLEAMAPISVGILAGGALSLALTRLMSEMLFEVKPTDPATFASVAAAMLGAALMAAFWPSLRASRVDPITALRQD